MKTKWSSEEMVEGIGKLGSRPHYHYLSRALQPQNTVLEVGCGPCHLFRHLTAKGVQAKYSACDLTSEMLAKGREAFPEMRLFECDVQDMSNVPDNSYDWVVCSDVLIHVPRPLDGLTHLWRCTGGALLLVIRESTYPQDLVDLERAYQIVGDVRYHYNVLNRDQSEKRLRGLAPAPRAVDIHRLDITGPKGSTSLSYHLPFAHGEYPVWLSTYVLLKDPSRVRWLGAGTHGFSKRSLCDRILRKVRHTLNMCNRWDQC